MKRRAIMSIFNRGRVSRLALARSDVDRVSLSAEVQTNWIPRVLGSMMLRPGLGYITGTKDNAQSVTLPFVFSNSDYAGLELTGSAMRVLVSGTDVLTRSAGFASTITNGAFGSDVASWTDNDDAGAASTWATGGYLQLLGTGASAARRYQAISIAPGDQDLVHSFRIVIQRGNVGFRIGTSLGDDDVFTQASLRTGTHSIAFTPGAATVYVEFFSTLKYPTLVDSIAFEAAGAVEIPTPWASAADCRLVRAQQVNDVVFCACDGYKQKRVERRANNSWSVVDFDANDGPFGAENTTNLSLTPSALSGAITLTASQPVFSATDVGVLYRITSAGQLVAADVSSENTFSNSIRISGVGDSRNFTIRRAGTWVGTISVQRSIGEPGAWSTVQTYTTNGSSVYDESLDNQIVYYRIGIEAGNYTSGTAELTLEDGSGSVTGTVRVTGFTSTTEVDAIVLNDLGGVDATSLWAKGSWGGAAGYPTAVALYEGRVWWSGRGSNWASVSDSFNNYDPEYEGDAGPINRAVGQKGVDRTNWMLPMQRLLVGTDGAEHSVRSSSLDEPVTPSNYNVKEVSTLGSATVAAVQVDRTGVFVERGGTRIYELNLDGNGYDYAASSMTALVPEIGDAGFVKLVVQRQPDTRLHCIRADGTVAMMLRDPAEDVLCWLDVETTGAVEDAYVLPGIGEDQVFYTVARTIGGETARYHERWAQETEARGGQMSKIADSFVAETRTASATMTGLGHLEGEEVVIWGDGLDLGAATVSGGSIALPSSVANVCAGLPYSGAYKSAKITVMTKEYGSTLSMRSRVSGISLILADTHARGLEYGADFVVMDNLPLTEGTDAVGADVMWDAYSEEMMAFPGEWSNDSRLCLRATAPRPATVLAAVVDVEWNA